MLRRSVLSSHKAALGLVENTRKLGCTTVSEMALAGAAICRASELLSPNEFKKWCDELKIGGDADRYQQIAQAIRSGEKSVPEIFSEFQIFNSPN